MATEAMLKLEQPGTVVPADAETKNASAALIGPEDNMDEAPQPDLITDDADVPDTSGTGETAVPISLVEVDDCDAVLNELGSPEANWVRLNGFRGKLGQVLCLPNEQGGLDRVLFGWGDAAARNRERFHLGDFARQAPPGTFRLEDSLDADAAEEAALGWLLGRYRFTKYKSAGEEHQADLLAPPGVDPTRLIRMVEGVFLTRDLINTPASDMTPATLEATARKIADRHGAEIDVVVGEDLLTKNFPMIHAVGRAAAAAPRLIDITWGDPDYPSVTLVGKGVCFDTGGLNLKPGASMGLMKKDMGGAATVLGLGHMIMALGLPLHLRILVPAVENAVARGSMRPGDVLTSRLGKTVEINNTDAEGRLILADALALAAEAEPDLIIDMATLTGAARVALGPEVVPYYTNDSDLSAALEQAGAAAADPLWRMPLWPGYERDIEPDIADLDNAPKGGMAGSITAALFLQRFVGSTPWAHFDVYGWTPTARPGRPKGGECQGARAILRVLEARYGDKAG
ncbi:MAG: leucyl aminopeptidase family protein [Pseudomonadota bacterium]